MKLHRLKTWPEEYSATVNDIKTFEVRKNDRSFSVGDTLVLDEWNPDTEKYTGRVAIMKVTYLLQGKFGLPEDLCVMGIVPTSTHHKIERLDEV